MIAYIILEVAFVIRGLILRDFVKAMDIFILTHDHPMLSCGQLPHSLSSYKLCCIWKNIFSLAFCAVRNLKVKSDHREQE